MKKQKKQGILFSPIAAILLVLVMPKLVLAVAAELKENVNPKEIPGSELFLNQTEEGYQFAEPPEFARFFSEIFDLDPDIGLREADDKTLEKMVDKCDDKIDKLGKESQRSMRMFFYLMYCNSYFNNPVAAVTIQARYWMIYNAMVLAALTNMSSERGGFVTALARLRSKSQSGGDGEGCFQADTMVLLADGCAREISKIKVGEMVKSYNVEKNVIEDKEVEELYTFATEGYYVINGSLKATAKHPFLIAGEGETWKKASELEIGDQIQSTDSIVTVRSIEFVKEDDVAYNFLLKDNKAYIVSSGDKYYIVHNGL